MYEVTMPKLSDTMEDGKIIAWKVKPGDAVHEGDILAEIESDKAVMELECYHDGVIAEVRKPDGAEVRVGEVIAVIGPEGAEKPKAPHHEEREGREEPAPDAATEKKPETAEAGEAEPAEQAAPQVRPAAAGAKTVGPAPAVKETEAPESEEPAAAQEQESRAEARPLATAKPAPARAEAPQPQRAEPGRAAISPYARKLAEDKDVDTTKVRGTGPGGRIVAADIERAARPADRTAPARLVSEHGRDARATTGTAAPAGAPSEHGWDASATEDHGQDARATTEAAAALTVREPADTGESRLSASSTPSTPSADNELPAIELRPGEADVEEANYRQRTQARRVTQVKHLIPHFYVTSRADVTELMERRAALKEKHGATVTHVIEFAALRALAKHPSVNRSYDHGRIIRWSGVNLGLAVATEQGLTVGVLPAAESLPFAELVTRSNELVERARSGKLTPDDRRHPSFTISNLGMYGVEQFAPIINPPSAITLAVASAQPEAIVREGAIRIGQVLRLTASCDHRVVDGVAAAEFLRTLAGLIESPDELMKES